MPWFYDTQAYFLLQMSGTIGPVGREVEAAFNVSEKGVGATYTYSFSKGIFGGIALETALLNVRGKENERFYGKAAKPQEILLENAVESPKDKGIEEVSWPGGYLFVYYFFASQHCTLKLLNLLLMSTLRFQQTVASQVGSVEGRKGPGTNTKRS